MDLEGLVVKKGLKGKQNKKMWKKNIDVSGLLQKIQNDQIQETRKKYAKPLIVEDSTKKVRQELDPNRFKNRVKSQPKKVYDNTFKRPNLISDGNEDIWGMPAQSKSRKTQQLIVPTIIKPPTGHSYNPSKEDVKAIVEEVIDYEKLKPRKIKKIKKIQEKPIKRRIGNQKLRQQFYAAKKRREQRQALTQIYSSKKIKRQLEQKYKKINEKIQAKQKQKQQRLQEMKTGKVREGPKLGKLSYKYRQYIPNEDEINKKISKVGQSDQLIKQQYDNIFRRGIFEPRTVKVHRNKKKNIKVISKFEEDN